MAAEAFDVHMNNCIAKFFNYNTEKGYAYLEKTCGHDPNKSLSMRKFKEGIRWKKTKKSYC